MLVEQNLRGYAFGVSAHYAPDDADIEENEDAVQRGVEIAVDRAFRQLPARDAVLTHLEIAVAPDHAGMPQVFIVAGARLSDPTPPAVTLAPIPVDDDAERRAVEDILGGL